MKKIVITLVLLISTLSFAQIGSIGSSDAVSTSMGKTYAAASRGIYAIGINPANLQFENPGGFEFALPNLSLRLGTNFLTINEFNYFFGGVPGPNGGTVARYLTADDKDRMRNLFADGGSFLFDVNMLDFAVVYKPSDKIGTFGFSIQDLITAQFTFPAGVIDLALSGNPLGKEYTFDDTKLKMSWLRSYNFSYARDISFIAPKTFKQISVGVGLKYVQGFAYVGIDQISTKLVANADYSITEYGNVKMNTAFSPDFGIKYGFDSTAGKTNFKFSGSPQSAGSGMGFDFGLSAVINDRWSIALALTDIGSVKWNTNAAEYSSSSSFTLKDLSDSTQRDSLVKRAKGDGKYISSFSTPLPTTLRIGTQWVVKPNVFTLSADLNAGLNDAPRNYEGTRYSIGGVWNPGKWSPYLRGGFSWGGGELFSWGVGIGFKVWKIEFAAATSDFQYIFSPKDGKRVGITGGWRFKFD
jgi:hypothetical protein